MHINSEAVYFQAALYLKVAFMNAIPEYSLMFSFLGPIFQIHFAAPVACSLLHVHCMDTPQLASWVTSNPALQILMMRSKMV